MVQGEVTIVTQDFRFLHRVKVASQVEGPKHLDWEKHMFSALYAVGYLLLVVVVSYLAYLSHIPRPYIFAIDVIMLGIGVVTGVEAAHQRDSDY
jgi:hypothetical protein